jgi:hypothetical protein
MEQLMKLCNKFMLRRTSTVLKSLLPAKVEQVRWLRSSAASFYCVGLQSSASSALFDTFNAAPSQLQNSRYILLPAVLANVLLAVCCCATCVDDVLLLCREYSHVDLSFFKPR